LRHCGHAGDFADADRLFHAGVDADYVDQAAQHEHALYQGPRGGQQEVTAGLPNPALRSRECCRASAVDECQVSEIDDRLPAAGCYRRERSGYFFGVCQVELTAQRDDEMIGAFTDYQIHAEHLGAFLRVQQGGVQA
jgi:hypothetical protein